MLHEYENERDVVVSDLKVDNSLDAEVLREAKAADDAEHKMTIADGWRTHKKAILWSMALSGALIVSAALPSY